jgi:VanZ family protein
MSLRLALLVGLLGITAWLFLAPNPLPFGIAVQREAGWVGHAGIFTVMTLAISFLYPRALPKVIAALLIMAVFLEAAQLLVPTRGADMFDFAMNVLGILLGFMIFRVIAAFLKGSRLKADSEG